MHALVTRGLKIYVAVGCYIEDTFFASVCPYPYVSNVFCRKGQVHKLNYRESLPTTQENLNKLIRFICYRLFDHFKSMKCLVWNINYTDGCTMNGRPTMWYYGYTGGSGTSNTSFCTILRPPSVVNKQNTNNAYFC